jgi:sec-independent protein translocase protein TatC
MTIGEHLEELRWRLLKALLGVVAAGLVTFWQRVRVVEFLRRPIDRAFASTGGAGELVQTTPFGAFLADLKVVFFAALVVSGPWTLHQVWGFIGAGLYRHEKRVVRFYAIPGFLLFLAGAALAWGYVMPFALRFLIQWAADGHVRSQINVGDYVNLIAASMMVFGLVFQLPLIMVFLMRIGVVEPAFFRKYRRHAIVVDFVVAMVLTPPDVVSQIALALCLILLYEGAIFVGARVARPRGEVPQA